MGHPLGGIFAMVPRIPHPLMIRERPNGTLWGLEFQTNARRSSSGPLIEDELGTTRLYREDPRGYQDIGGIL